MLLMVSPQKVPSRGGADPPFADSSNLFDGFMVVLLL
jgi:hypothetical protein